MNNHSYSSSSSSSSSSFDETTNTNTYTYTNSIDLSSNYHHETKPKQTPKKPNYIFIISFIFFLFFLTILFINIIIIIIYKKKSKTSTKTIHHHSNNKYEMIYYQYTNMNTNVNEEIIEITNEGFKIDGDFFAYKNENEGYGMIINMESEGKKYKICIDECECYVNVECEKNDDCKEEGMICEGYKCIGTKIEVVERKFASVVVVTVPLLMCTLGLFTSMYLAKEYGERYFIDECKETCSKTVDDVEKVNYETSIDDLGNKKDVYHCAGPCSIEDDKFNELMEERIDEYIEKVGDFPYDRLSFLKELNFNNYPDFDLFCSTNLMESDIIASNVEEATQLFFAEASVQCRNIEMRWQFDLFSYRNILKDVTYDNPLSSVIFNNELLIEVFDPPGKGICNINIDGFEYFGKCKKI